MQQLRRGRFRLGLNENLNEHVVGAQGLLHPVEEGPLMVTADLNQGDLREARRGVGTQCLDKGSDVVIAWDEIRDVVRAHELGSCPARRDP